MWQCVNKLTCTALSKLALSHVLYHKPLAESKSLLSHTNAFDTKSVTQFPSKTQWKYYPLASFIADQLRKHLRGILFNSSGMPENILHGVTSLKSDCLFLTT